MSSVVHASPGAKVRTKRGRALAAACGAHALHDGYTDLIYVLLPVWQAEFALGYGALAALRGLYAGTMAALQMPAGRLAERWAPAPCWSWARRWRRPDTRWPGCRAGWPALLAALALSGAGSSTQHPLASAAVSRAWGGSAAARGALGTYNFAGEWARRRCQPRPRCC